MIEWKLSLPLFHEDVIKQRMDILFQIKAIDDYKSLSDDMKNSLGELWLIELESERIEPVQTIV